MTASDRIRTGFNAGLLVLALACLTASTRAQPAPSDPPPPGFGPPGRGPGPFGGPPPFGPGGPRFGGFGGEELKILAKFDEDKNGHLNAEERKAAREFVKQERESRGGGGFMRRGGPPGRFGAAEPEPGERLSPSDVPSYPDADLYDPAIIRTLFIEFENEDWEAELADFNNTDVEVPARVQVDGRTLRDVGVRFRGMSSFGMTPAGRKRSLNLSLDYVHQDQRIDGYKTLNLLNSHGDPTFLRSVLYLQIAREFIPAPKANFVRVVINGENWGIYVNAQQFNKDFAKDWFGTTKGARWKAPGSPAGGRGLTYLGDEIEPYKRIYEIKSKDTEASWRDLVRLCKVLNQTPAEELPAALEPILDVDGALRFLALEMALINNDGYWIRASDYNLYQDEFGKFHIVPHDANETFALPGGPGFGGPRGFRPRPGGGPGPDGPPAEAPQGRGDAVFGPDARPGADPNRGNQGLKLDPLFAASDPNKPLISKLLAVPQYRERYLRYVRQIAEQWLDWEKLGPIAKSRHDLIAADVAKDTRKLSSTEAFQQGLTEDTESFGPGGRTVSLKRFAEERRAYLLEATRSVASK